MNVFEDLVVELKEENLLENTVIDEKKTTHTENIPEAVEISDEADEQPELTAPDESANEQEVLDESKALTMSDEESGEQETAAPADDTGVEIVDNSEVPDISGTNPRTKLKKIKRGKEFFNKRAVDEVSGLQMVEHILTGVEREYMKVKPKTFDDFNAKKALNNFLNISENSNSEEHKAAEFALMQETEAWGLALLERDRHVAVANIRQYCENSRPALSSQAMLAIARFYRNAPYSESVRSKFDFVITRLFSRPVDQDRRVCLFDREEMLGHIQMLYSEWSSIPLYDAETDESNVLLTGLSFDDLANEAENASSFDQLIESDFFSRLRLFKESISELFYAPTVITAAIESNVRIGNAYVNLLVRERQKMDAASIQMKYGDFNDQTVSDAAGRTLDLVEVLNALTDDVIKKAEAPTEPVKEPVVETPSVAVSESTITVATERSSFLTRVGDGVRHINRWIVVAGFVGVLISGGLYVASTFTVEDKVSKAGVSDVELDNSILSEHIKSGKIYRGAFSGLLLPSWDTLPKEKREEYLQKVLQLGTQKGWSKVDLITKDGKAAGYASATKLEVYMP